MLSVGDFSRLGWETNLNGCELLPEAGGCSSDQPKLRCHYMSKCDKRLVFGLMIRFGTWRGLLRLNS